MNESRYKFSDVALAEIAKVRREMAQVDIAANTPTKNPRQDLEQRLEDARAAFLAAKKEHKSVYGVRSQLGKFLSGKSSDQVSDAYHETEKIGRASCRERV